MANAEKQNIIFILFKNDLSIFSVKSLKESLVTVIYAMNKHITVVNKDIYKIYLIMSKPKRDTPAVNYAKPVQSFPKKKKEVVEALTNQRTFQGNLDGLAERQSSNENRSTKKIYQIHHNKAFYQGEWKEGLPNGKGICIYQDGTYLQGNFEDGELNDNNAFIILPNGARYRGNVQRSQLKGLGKLQKGQKEDKSTYKYEGQWLNGKPHGQGKQQYGDGSKYDGTFVDGVKQCYNSEKTIKQKREYYEKHHKLPNQSTYTSSTGEVYKGQFKNGLMHGFGYYSQNSNNISYCGEFEQGKKKGYASLTTKDGVLKGYFENDVVNGQGEYIWNDGRRYVGLFKNNQFHGQGKIYMPNSTVLEGVWEEGHNKQMRTISKQY